MGLTAMVAGMILVIGISTVHEYVSMQRTLSFALKNGIYQASKAAMVPELLCTIEETEPDTNEEEPEYIEVCEEIYKSTEEYFQMLEDAINDYRQNLSDLKLELMAYEPNPFLARARLKALLKTSFWYTEITVEEIVIAK